MPDFGHLTPEAQIIGRFIARDCNDQQSRMVQRCDCILLAEYKSLHPLLSAEEITALFNNFQGLQVGQAKVEATIDTMIQRGSYYRNLEKALGAGSTLALGTSISETNWTKSIGKSGKTFDNAVQHLLQTPLFHLSQQHAELRVRLVSHQLQYMQSWHALHMSHASVPVSLRLTGQQFVPDPDLLGDMLLNCITNTPYEHNTAYEQREFQNNFGVSFNVSGSAWAGHQQLFPVYQNESSASGEA